MPHFAAYDLILHCLPMSHKNDARLKWVKHEFRVLKMLQFNGSFFEKLEQVNV